MKLGVAITRITCYRQLAPIIAAAFEADWEVECFYLDGEEARPAGKAYQRALAHGVPTFGGARPEVRTFESNSQLGELARGVDRVVSLHGRSAFPGLGGVDTPWVSVQHGIDYFNLGADYVLSADLNCLYSEYWRDLYLRLAPRLEGAEVAERAAAKLAGSTRSTGMVQLDALGGIDPQEVRQRWGVPAGRPVVLYLPSSPCAHQKLTPWCRWIYSEPSRARQIWNATARLRDTKALTDALRGWSDAAVIRAVRRFCDANDAFLIVKSRRKTPPTEHERAAADLVLLDESYYPSTFLEAATIADLVIAGHNTTTTVTEAVYAGLPVVLVDLPVPRALVESNQPIHGVLEDEPDPALWRCAGAIWRLDPGELARELPRRRLDDFRPDPEARRRYVTKLLGNGDGGSARRALAAIEAM